MRFICFFLPRSKHGRAPGAPSGTGFDEVLQKSVLWCVTGREREGRFLVFFVRPPRPLGGRKPEFGASSAYFVAIALSSQASEVSLPGCRLGDPSMGRFHQEINRIRI